ncbi:MAG: aspartate aminotransferase family protein [Holosporales bacterium]
MATVSPVLPVYKPFPVDFVRGQGCMLYDAAGKGYLDFGSGVAVNALGHCHPALVKALGAQAETIWHCSNWYPVEGQRRLGQLLIDNSFADYVFFGNSGTEAIECGIKVVRSYFSSAGQPEKFRIIASHNAFHGRTFAALAAGGKPGFAPALDGFDHVPYGDIEALKAAITPATAGILLEPIQGEGGIFPASLDYLRAVRALCDERGVLLFFDEIQSGIGRTGKLFAHEWAGIKPDVLASAKGLGGGFPVGACLMTRGAARGMTSGTHGSTFGGNPLAMAVGAAVLHEILAPGFLARVDSVARLLWRELVQLVKDAPQTFSAVRGAGLMLGLECAAPHVNRDIADALLAEGLLVIPAGANVIRLIPPLIITDADVAHAIKILRTVAAHG